MRIFPIKGKYTPLKLPNGDQVLAQSDGNRFYLDITTATGTSETKQFESSKELLNYLKKKGFDANPDLERLQKIPETFLEFLQMREEALEVADIDEYNERSKEYKKFLEPTPATQKFFDLLDALEGSKTSKDQEEAVKNLAVEIATEDVLHSDLEENTKKDLEEWFEGFFPKATFPKLTYHKLWKVFKETYDKQLRFATAQATSKKMLKMRKLPDSAISDLNEKEREVLKAAKKLADIWTRVPENLPEKEYDELFEDEIQPAERELAHALSQAYSGEDPQNVDWATEEAQESGRTYLQWERLVLSHYFEPNKRVFWYFWDAASGDTSTYNTLQEIYQDDKSWEDYNRVWDDSTTAHIGILNEVTIWDIIDKQARDCKFYGWIASKDEYIELSDDFSEDDVKAQGITKVYEGLEAIALTSPESRHLKRCVELGLALEQSQFGHPHMMKAITTEYAQAIELLERKIRDALEVRDLALGFALFRALEKESIRRLSSDQVKEIQATLVKYS